MTPGRQPGAQDEHKVTFDVGLAKRLWVYIRPHQFWVWLSFALLLVNSAFGLVQPYLMKIAIDDYIKVEGQAAFESNGFVWVLIGIGVFSLLELVGRSIQTYTLTLGGQNALIDLRLAVFRHLQKLSARFFDRTPIGRLIGRVTTDIESLNEMFASGVVTILGDLVNMVAILAMLFWLNWKLTLVALLMAPVLFGLTMIVRKFVRAAYMTQVAKRSKQNAFLHEQSSGMPLIQSFRREERTYKAFDEINVDYMNAELETVKWESILSALTDMLSSVTMALILWYGGGLALEAFGLSDEVKNATGAVTLGMLVAFLQYTERFFGPLNELSMKYTVMQSAMTAASRIFGLMDNKDFTDDAAASKPASELPPAETRGAIRFEDVTFGYGDNDPVIKNLTFEVAPGERVAFVGATGAGKSTILKLITRLYDIRSGSITLDGRLLTDYPLADLRNRIGIVPQDVFLFAGNLLENIRLGHPEITNADAEAAAAEMHLDRITRRLPGGLREPVRERGKNLSSGERQLIAFARVLAVAPAVLALDEATSNVDSEMEHLLQEAVHKLMQGRTSLIIAHRLSTIRDVDRILVMHKGELVEEGNHEALLQKEGFYWRLHQMQYANLEA